MNARKPFPEAVISDPISPIACFLHFNRAPVPSCAIASHCTAISAMR
jgi:hypothetical protein